MKLTKELYLFQNII